MSQSPDSEREWQLQEQALLEERRGASAAGTSTTGASTTGASAIGANATGTSGNLAQYRLIARALRSPPIEPLPQDFAASTAAQVEQLAAPMSDRLEMWLQRLLFAILLLIGLVVAAKVGSEWILLAASGIGLSLLVELAWRSRAQSGLSRAL